jgi:hypothetical protein
MARKSLRPQLNQIRAWVRQGRTDAWIAHQLDVPAAQLKDFISRHALQADEGEGEGELDLRDEIEAEIEAELDEIDAAPEEEDEEEEEEEEEREPAGDGEEDDERPKRRRRRRRGGRGRRKKGPLEATFDHGEEEGYGLWLDPAVKDDPTYSEHWAGHRAIKVTIEPERIVLERMEGE